MQTQLPEPVSLVESPSPGAKPGLAPWWLPVRLLIACLLLVGLWQWVGQEPQRQWQPAALIHVTAGDQHYRLSAGEMANLQAYSADYFRERAQQGQAILHSSTEAHLDQLFSRVESQLPVFLDWYYSSRGLYTRDFMWLMSKLPGYDGDFVQERAEQMLFHDTNWQGSLVRLETSALAQLASQDAKTREGWLAGVMERLTPHQVPAPLPSGEAQEQPERLRLNINTLEQQLAEASMLSMNERLSANTGAAIAGAFMLRGAASGVTALSARRAAARGASRGTARVGGAAAGGGLACAPTGPLALGCAVAAGTVAWLSFDWALLKVEEQLRRDEVEAALKESLLALRRQVEGDIQSALAADIASQQQLLQSHVSGHFLPMQGRMQE